ncbi:MFS transporter [Purpureocillium lilacinum]|uniref:MFS transporter n=1 Tax=Purpureocillium lilacinum TaxID=33203 RepID=A0A179GJB8_PURLI|nr:MFS transporter [Purpureocillium lilacinum]OAQ77947.1 MFS transporter [Purpureocillium lilacinum]
MDPGHFSMPPGTVRLINEDGELHKRDLIFQPVPTKDPNDPLNWTRSRKLVNFVPILVYTTMMFTMAAIPAIFWVLWVPEFDSNYSEMNTSLAIAYAGTSVGCVFFIPVAIKYGRRSVYIVSLTAMLVCTVWQAKMTTIVELYVSSLILGMANATNETIVQMTVADMYFIHQRGTANGAYTAMVMTGSFLSPMIAGYIAADAVLFVFFCLFFEETKYIPHIEAEVPLSPRNSGENPSQKSPDTKPAVDDLACVSNPRDHSERIDKTIPLLTWRQRLRLITKTDESLWNLTYLPFFVAFRFPLVLYTGLQYAATLCWISVQASVISIAYAQPPYNFGTIGIGNMNVPIYIGCIFGAVYGGLLSDWSVIRLARRNHGYYEPEMRLHLLHGTHWIFPSIGSAIFGFACGSIFDLAITVLIDSYQITGEAFVAVAFIRNVVSMAVFFAINPWIEAQGLQNMFIVMGILAIVIGFAHVPVIIWGKRGRERTASRYLKLVELRKHSRV